MVLHVLCIVPPVPRARTRDPTAPARRLCCLFMCHIFIDKPPGFVSGETLVSVRAGRKGADERGGEEQEGSGTLLVFRVGRAVGNVYLEPHCTRRQREGAIHLTSYCTRTYFTALICML